MSTSGGLAGTLTRTLRRGSSLFQQSKTTSSLFQQSKTGLVPVGSITQEAEVLKTQEAQEAMALAMALSTQEAVEVNTKEVITMTTQETGEGRSTTKARKGRFGGSNTKTERTTQEEQLVLTATSMCHQRQRRLHNLLWLQSMLWLSHLLIQTWKWRLALTEQVQFQDPPFHRFLQACQGSMGLPIL